MTGLHYWEMDIQIAMEYRHYLGVRLWQATRGRKIKSRWKLHRKEDTNGLSLLSH